MTILNIDGNNLSRVDPELLAKVVINLESLNIVDTKLTEQQVAAILSAISEGNNLCRVYIDYNSCNRTVGQSSH